MALTAKPISTIAYNSEGHLKRTLDRLIEAEAIEDYRYIFHEGEDGDKDHYHLWIQPNRRLDTAKLRKEFDEADPKSNKPLGVLPFRSSKSDHWILYAIHDAEYLRNHNAESQDGKKPYSLEQIETPYPDQLKRDYRSALPLRRTQNQEIIERLTKQHQSMQEIMYDLQVNPLQVVAISNAITKERWEQEAKEQRREKMEEVKAIAQLSPTVTVEEDLTPIKGIATTMKTTYALDKKSGELQQVSRDFVCPQYEDVKLDEETKDK